MYKFRKRLAALVLAATVVMTSSVFASSVVNSPVSGTTNNSSSTVSGKALDTKQNTDIEKAKSTTKNLVIASIVKQDTRTFAVTRINTGAVSGKKYNKITIYCKSNVQFQKQVIKGKSLKSKKLIITIANGQSKLKAKNFNKKAFKGFKGTITVKKKAMTKKEFNKLKKKLKKGGFKGTIKLG